MPLHLLALPRACFRAARFALHLFYGVLLAAILPSLSIALQKRIVQRWSAELLEIFCVHISTTGPITLPEVKTGMIVANHISWLDVIVLNSILPLRFVAKSEVRHWPVIGWLCAQAQTLFIERGKRSDTARTNLRIAESLRQGNRMAIFPEGTTTDGSQVRHFHSSLLQPAVDAQTPIYPVAIAYHDKHNMANLDAAYIDDATFIESLWKILSSRDLHVRITTTPALDTQVDNRRALSLEAHRRIVIALSPTPLPATQTHADAIHTSGDESQSRFQSSYSLLLYAPIKF